MIIFVEVSGWSGALLILGAYALVSLDRLHTRSAVYQVMNVAGAAGILVNSGWSGALPSAALNVIWMGIGLYSLSRARGRNQPRGLDTSDAK